MEATRGKGSKTEPEAKTRHDLIVEVWLSRGRPAIGAAELGAIQVRLEGRFGEHAVESPAAIARVLADEGAELRHPEVIECDAQWRAEHLGRFAHDISEIDALAPHEALTLRQAENLIERLAELLAQHDAADAHRLRTIAIEAKKAAQLRAKRKSLDEAQRTEQLEIAEWLGVWLRTPNLFKDWLDLRRRSEDFRRKFSDRL